MMRNAFRLVFIHPRFWIPGSAARPRNDAENIETAGHIEKSAQNGV